jgi:glycolate oxidase iron-sulfur subunit
MAVLAGCVQPGLAPEINAAAARVLDRLQISLEEIKAVGCCGAVNFHLEDTKAARDQARRVIDAVWPELQNGLEALVMTASGCGVFVRDYPDLLKEDPAYADKAAQIVARTFDLSEVILRESPSWPTLSSPVKLAFHSPCTLQHGQKLKGGVEGILRNRGGVLTEVADGHLCCGSAGTYSLLQSEIATRLRDARLTALERGEPEYILTANIGCLTHLQSGTTRPVMHWIDWLDQTWSDAQQKAE